MVMVCLEDLAAVQFWALVVAMVCVMEQRESHEQTTPRGLNTNTRGVRSVA